VRSRGLHFAGSPVIVVRRSAAPFTSREDIERHFGALNDAIDRIDKPRYGLLVDIRLVAGQNDSEFELAFGPHRTQLERGFRRVAVLVGSPAGRLQVQRHALQDRLAVRAFTDEAEALEWLRGKVTHS
jgi:SpoIIAA-like